MWFRLLMLAFVFNGFCTFGIRILTGLGMSQRYTSTYLAIWYLAGALFLLVLALRSQLRIKRTEAMLGCGLGLCSWGGQTALGLALARGLPGSMVFPVVLAGGLFLVVAAGVLIFKESMGFAGKAGILLGILSVVLLSLS